MKKITFLFLIFILHLTSAQQAFDCDDGNFYQVISGVMKAYDPITGSYSETLHTYSSYNAGGYNAIDNYLYAIKSKDNHLLRIAKDMVIDLGAVAPNGTNMFGGGYAADIDVDGNLWVFQNNTKKTFHKIINLKQYNGTTAPTFEVIEADVASPSTCADITYINGSFYGGSRGKLYKWDLSSGTPIFSSKTVSNLPKSTFGAAYTDADNRLYLSDNSGGLYLVNNYESANPTATLLNLTETTNSNDGFKCANGISPLDKDKDGILDSMDGDGDGDGILNTIECNGMDPYGDDDGDDLYNYLDNDFSGNGDNVVQDAFDRDRDGIPDFMDIDSDNDGIYDIAEAGQADIDINNDGIYSGLDTNYADTDFDGIADFFDADQAGFDLMPIDTDNDTIYDCYDIDSDNDGIVDIIEGQNSITYLNLSNKDEDKDGLDDAFDPDFGGTINGLVNTDGTDTYDHLDTDSNNDGILDTTEAYDSDNDGVAETTASGNDADQDGLDDSFDLRKTSFDPDNGGQTPESFPIPLICDRYNYLGNYTIDGTPLYLDEQDVVTQETIDMINNALPEGYPVPDFNPHYISSGYDTDLIVKEQTDIWVTFVGEGAGYKNTLGFYTYDRNDLLTSIPAPEDIIIVFPNVSAMGSGGGLQIGDKINIGSFPPNTGIGWVLLANAWSNGCVGTGNWQLYSESGYNPESDPELRYHNVLLSDPNNERIILGFEDIRRDYASCDQDFNDAVFYITANPYTGIKTDNYVTIDNETSVTSANDGGLESNGNLASLIAKRNFNRTKTNSIFNTKKSQQQFKPGMKSYKSANGEDLSIHFPKTGISGTESTFISSPEDLLGITNAEAVFSIDYYQGDKRVAAALATSTKGTIYDHSKTICDRLNGSKLLDIRTITIKKHTIVSTKIKRITGEIEYVLTFSIKKATSENEIYSLWNIADYPKGDYTNFQVWSGSISQVATIANYNIESFLEKKPLRSHKVSQCVPTIFVKNGHYSNGKIALNIVNKLGENSMTFDGNIRTTEHSNEQHFTKNIILSGTYNEEVTIDTGYLFDIGFSITTENATQLDALYLADGPWGIDYKKQEVIIESFEITAHEKMQQENKYAIERNTIVKGEVKETINLFRNILAGELTMDVSDYNTLQFEIHSNRDIEVILITKDLVNWNNRLSYTIEAKDETQVYNIPFSEFTGGSNASNIINNIKSIVFSLAGDYQNFEPFYLEIGNVSFITNTETGIVSQEQIPEDIKNKVLKNYPNPFATHTSIQVPNGPHKKLNMMVIDILGRVVYHQNLKVASDDEVVFEPQNLQSGMYKYILRSNTKQKYSGSFIKK